MKGVQVFKSIRSSLKWSRYKMAKELGISQTQYDYLEKTAQSCQKKILLSLWDVCKEELLMEPGDFWAMFVKEESEK